jgi:HD-like signal output (HDOD) protein
MATAAVASVASASAVATPNAAPPNAAPPNDVNELVRQAVKKVSAIATLPEVTAQIIKTVEDPKSSAQQLHKIVSYDPALVTRILKVVNSSFYGLPGQIASIDRAIVLLGLNAVKNIAVAASIGQLFRGVKLCEGFTAKDLWKHCIAVGVVAREIAKQMKVPLGDEAFLAGMIHDVGLLVSLQTAPEQLRNVCEAARNNDSADFCQLEREAMNGLDHQMLGAGLAELWKFPMSCRLVAGHHHQPSSSPDQQRLLLWLVYAADTLCAQGQQGFNLTALHQRLDDAGLADVQIDAALIERTRANLAEIVQAASPML